VADVVMKGNAKALPCRAHWHFAADGPLGFLREARQLGSFRMSGFRLHFA
jgi:acetoacetate decarboxylase